MPSPLSSGDAASIVTAGRARGRERAPCCFAKAKDPLGASLVSLSCACEASRSPAFTSRDQADATRSDIVPHERRTAEYIVRCGSRARFACPLIGWTADTATLSMYHTRS